MKYTTRQSQRGVAALIVTLLLFLALALTAFGLHRHLMLDQRSAANHVRAAQAFEAAAAGLDWAQAQLNSTQRIGADCKPSTAPNARTFRARYLTLDRVTGVVSPTAAQPGCARTASGWAFGCPAGGAACTADCGRAVLDALDAGSTLIWVDGDLALAGDAAVGSAARPIVIVATGQIRLTAGGAVTGAIYGASITLIGDDATVHGAILSEGS